MIYNVIESLNEFIKNDLHSVLSLSAGQWAFRIRSTILLQSTALSG